MHDLRDFRNFLYLVWKHLNLPDPTPVQYDIAYFLQHGPKRCVIEAFRGVGKSWVTSAFVCWVLLMDPQKNILVVSASKERADAFSTFTKRLINEMEILAHLRSRPEQRNSNVAFDVGPARASHSPSVKSVGINGQLAGSRADIIISDDVEIPTNSMTQTLRDKLSEQVKEYDAVLKPTDDARIIYLGTPQTEDSLYNKLPERGYEIRVWPARIPANVDSYKGRLSPYILNMIDQGAEQRDPVDPVRFNDFDLIEREASYGRTGFAMQFMLDTSLSDSDRYPLKVSDLIIMSLDNQLGPVQVAWGREPTKKINDLQNLAMTGDAFYSPIFISETMAPYSGCVMSIDPSGRGADETAYAVVKILHGKLYLVASGGFRDGYSETTLKALSLIAKEHQVNYIITEANFGDGMFTQILKPVLAKIHPCTVEEVKHSTQKERRIADTLEPVMNQHRLIVDRKVIEQDYKGISQLTGVEKPERFTLVYQLSRLTRDRGALVKDDRLDALAMAVGYWVESMARDSEQAADEHREEMLRQELEGFINNVVNFGHSEETADGYRWFSL